MNEEMTAACLAARRCGQALGEPTLSPRGPVRDGMCEAAGAALDTELVLALVMRSEWVPLTTARLTRLAGPCLAMPAAAAAVPHARHQARQLMQDTGMKQLAGPVELIVSEIVTNSVRACGDPSAVIRLWVARGHRWVLVLVGDTSTGKPQLQQLDADAEGGRGLLLIDALSTAWGSFELVGEPGKIVWALCRG